jgi:hypothetical protein
MKNPLADGRYLNDEDRYGFPVNKTYTKIKHPLKNLEASG